MADDSQKASEPQVVGKAKWWQARAELLADEKALTQARQALAEKRRRLPWVKLTKHYQFVGDTGPLSLAELFEDASQLIVYHFMFGAGWEKPCPGCAAWADAFNGTTDSFKAADARLVAVSRAPYSQLAATAARRNWSFNWVSSAETDFNEDFYASNNELTESSSTIIEGTGEEVGFDRGENHGVSIFAKNSAGELFHTYSSYNRGIEDLNASLTYMDLLPKGRAN